MSNVISNSASELVKAMKIQDENKKEELIKSINNHALNAAGLGLIPVPLADIAALTVNVWHMYIKLNKILGISFKDNVTKSIASAALANLSGNLLGAGLISMLKFIPGGAIAAGVVVAATNYAICFSSAWIYLEILTTVAKKNNGNITIDDIPEKEIKRMMKDKKGEQQDIAKDAKSEYVNDHKDDK